MTSIIPPLSFTHYSYISVLLWIFDPFVWYTEKSPQAYSASFFIALEVICLNRLSPRSNRNSSDNTLQMTTHYSSDGLSISSRTSPSTGCFLSWRSSLYFPIQICLISGVIFHVSVDIVVFPCSSFVDMYLRFLKECSTSCVFSIPPHARSTTPRR